MNHFLNPFRNTPSDVSLNANGTVWWIKEIHGSAATWSDLVGTKHATAATGEQPVLDTINGRLARDFDGIADFYSMSSVVTTGEFTIAVVLKRGALGAVHSVLGGIHFIQFRTDNTTVQIGSSVFTIPTTVVDQLAVLIVTRDASDNINLYWDGTVSVTGAISNATAFDFSRVGKFSTAFYEGHIAEVIVWDRVMGATEAGNTRTFLNAKWTTVVPAAGGFGCTELDLTRFTVYSNERTIGVEDNTSGTSEFWVDGERYDDFVAAVGKGYSGAMASRLSSGPHTIKVDLGASCQTAVINTDPKPVTSPATAFYVGLLNAGDADGSLAVHQVGYKNLVLWDYNLSSATAGTSIPADRHVIFEAGTYDDFGPAFAIMIQNNNVWLDGSAGCTFEGKYNESVQGAYTWSPTAGETDIYETPFPDNDARTVQLIYDGIRLGWHADKAALVANAGFPGCAKDGTKVYARIPAGSQPLNSLMDIADSLACVDATSKSGFRMTGFTVQNFRKRCVNLDRCDNLTVEGNAFRFVAQVALYILESDDLKVENNTFTDETKYMVWDRMKDTGGIANGQGTESITDIFIDGITTGLSWVIANNTFTGLGDAIILRDFYAAEIYGNVVLKSVDNPIVSNRGQRYNAYWDNFLEGRDGWAYDSDGEGPVLESQNVGIYDYTTPFDTRTAISAGVKWRGSGHNITISDQCTFLPHASSPKVLKGQGSAIDFGQAAHQHYVARNCIFVGEDVFDHGVSNTLIFDNNIYFPTASPTNVPYRFNNLDVTNLAGWVTATGDTNSVETDPLLDEDGNPMVGSPVIAAATNYITSRHNNIGAIPGSGT